jgi:CheY-like chemotaxis protein
MEPTSKFLKEKKILVIDDEKDLRELISDELKDLGGEAFEAEDLNHAIKQLSGTFFDIILTDMKMPGGTGEEILKTVNQTLGKRSLVVIITGQSDISSEEIFDLGADAIFTKPYEMQLLLDALKFLLESPDKRWTRMHQRLESEFPVLLKLENLSNAIESKTINIGRGGMCIEILNGYPSIGQMMSFSIQSANGEKLDGIGICKWVNTQKEKIFVGIEFLSIDKNAIENIITYIKKMAPRAYIPKRKT